MPTEEALSIWREGDPTVERNLDTRIEVAVSVLQSDGSKKDCLFLVRHTNI
jgi:hypothetical protein